MDTIKEVLMRRDGMTEYQAAQAIEEAKLALQEYLEDGDMDAAENICAEYFGLEPDYVFELMF